LLRTGGRKGNRGGRSLKNHNHLHGVKRGRGKDCYPREGSTYDEKKKHGISLPTLAEEKGGGFGPSSIKEGE